MKLIVVFALIAIATVNAQCSAYTATYPIVPWVCGAVCLEEGGAHESQCIKSKITFCFNNCNSGTVSIPAGSCNEATWATDGESIPTSFTPGWNQKTAWVEFGISGSGNYILGDSAGFAYRYYEYDDGKLGSNITLVSATHPPSYFTACPPNLN
jgi:hypothetical protein